MKTLLKIVGVLLAVVVVVALGGLGYLMAAFPKVPPASSVKITATPEMLARGKYLNDHVVGCTECHTQRDWTKFTAPNKPELLGAGGMEFTETGYRVRSANITPDSSTGIGSWTEQQFIDKFKAFENTTPATMSETERRQNTVMPMMAYAGMSREDLSAIFAYLRTLKPITNRVERFPDAK